MFLLSRFGIHAVGAGGGIGALGDYIGMPYLQPSFGYGKRKRARRTIKRRVTRKKLVWRNPRTKAYRRRKAPLLSATSVVLGTRRRGKGGLYEAVRVKSSGRGYTHRWKLLKKKRPRKR